MIRRLRELVGSIMARVAAAASWSASQVLGTGSPYNATDSGRPIFNGRVPPQQTANQALTASLPALRAHCRNLERNNPTARAAVDGLCACIVGTGIALEPDTGDAKTDEKIREQWQAFIASCSVDGRSLYDLQHLGCREIVTVGELLWRLVVLPERIDAGQAPLAVLPLEAEWIDSTAGTITRNADGTVDVNGVRVDVYGRPISYRLKNPEFPLDLQTVPAGEIVHEFERRRALQSRGEPWFAPIIETMAQEQDLVIAEVSSAKNTAAMAMVITSNMPTPLDTTEDGTSDDPAEGIRLGGVARLSQGEDVKAFSHTRPSQQIAPFRSMLRGDVAGALRLSQRFLDRDVSKANYSSMRADMIDNERLHAPIREWLGHATAGRLYREALPYLALKAGVRMPRANYRLVPDGQPYVDPLKDAQAAAFAIAAGLSTFEAEIGKRSGDVKQVWVKLAAELKEANKLGLKVGQVPATAGGAAQNDATPADQTQKGNDE